MAEKKKRHKSIPETYLEFVPFYLIYLAVRRLSLRRAYALLGWVMRVVFFADRLHARRTVRHILHSGVATGDEAVKLAKRAYCESGKLLVEMAKEDQLLRPESFRIEAPEATLDYILPSRNSREFRGLIIVSAHCGNWEISGNAISRALGRNMTSLMRPFSNPLIGELFMRHRCSGTHQTFDKRTGIRPLLKALYRREIATVLIDQHAAAKDGVECEFFGHPARAHVSPALLHLRTGIPILPEVTVRLPGDDFRFQMTAGELIRYAPTGDKERDVAVVTQMCMSALEKLIRRTPEQWLWAPRHWLDIDRSCAAEYAGWRPKYPLPDGGNAPSDASASLP